MAKKNRSDRGFVYSTNPDFSQDSGGGEEYETSAPSDQDLRIWLDRKSGGKTATVVRGFEGSEADLKELGRALKALCGVGGTAKNGEIIVQGDHRDKVTTYLKKQGYGAKKAGG